MDNATHTFNLRARYKCLKIVRDISVYARLNVFVEREGIPVSSESQRQDTEVRILKELE